MTLVNVVDRTHMPLSAARLPSSMRVPIRQALTALKRQRYASAEHAMVAPRARLEQAGWAVTSEVRAGDPLAQLIDVVDEVRALDRSPCAVLIAR